MDFDLGQLPGANVYKLMTSTVVPRPIAWVVSKSAAGRLNAAPFSFFNALSGDPPVVAVGIGSRGDAMKDTARNIRDTGEFVANLVPYRMADAMNLTAAEFDADVDELRIAQLETTPSRMVAPPRIVGSPVALECKVLQVVDVPVLRTIVLAGVVGIHIDDDCVLDPVKCYVDTPRLDLVGRMHGGGAYVRTTDLFELPRVTVDEWARRQAAVAAPPKSG
jgi:flavin reductase (DIM6/NTAB) family NADH-FMN oxidoreductase RutF